MVIEYGEGESWSQGQGGECAEDEQYCQVG